MILKLYIIAFCIVAALGIYGVFIEPFQLRIKEWTVQNSKWHGQPDLKIAILTDIHAARPWMPPSRIEKIVQRTNSLNPDIILLLGDYVATHPFKLPVSAEEGIAPLKDLKAKCGIYAILGNHDFDKRTSGWPDALKKTGIPVFENHAKKIECGENKFWLAGLKDQIYQDPDLSNALKNTNDGYPVIMMMHEPDLFPETPKSVALTVAGHTHGGQVRIPFIGALLVPSKYGTRYAYGHIIENGKDLVVSGGLGSSILPVRFLMPPEITIVHLKASS